MKRIPLIAISIICILILSIGLAGCGNIKVKSNISENHPTTTSKANELIISNPLTASATVVPTQSSNSPSVDSMDGIDYSQYLKKIWIVKSWDSNKSYDNYFSFCIYKIANGRLEGKFMINGIVEPDDEFYSSNYLGNISGTINKNTAEFQFGDKNGNNGNVKLTLMKNDEIEANIKFTSKSKLNQDKSLDGTFQFKPYNLKDLEGFSPFNDQSFTVDLNFSAPVKFVSAMILGGTQIRNVAFLTS